MLACPQTNKEERWDFIDMFMRLFYIGDFSYSKRLFVMEYHLISVYIQTQKSQRKCFVSRLTKEKGLG